MRFRTWTEQRPAIGLDGTVHVLADDVGGARAEVWPALGFNCVAWQVRANGRPLDLLYADPNLWTGPVPTRSGIPVLFPFPNRIRAGRFAWNGREYQLPLLDSTKQNAIHGFACRYPWREAEAGADADSAWVRGVFQGSVAAPDARTLWPADYRLQLTIRLTVAGLGILAQVTNPDRQALPFGLGYHPYFRVAGPGSVEAAAASYWELQESLPTGRRLPVDRGRDLRSAKPYEDLRLDDVLTDLGGAPVLGRVLRPEGTLELRADADFRELVAFTPPHRQAICLEPYTCVTDAINLHRRGIEAGWKVLPPGGEWHGQVEMRWAPT